MLVQQELTPPGLAGNKRPSVSAVRALVSIAVMALAGAAVYFLADWAHLRTASGNSEHSRGYCSRLSSHTPQPSG